MYKKAELYEHVSPLLEDVADKIVGFSNFPHQGIFNAAQDDSYSAC